MDFLSALFQYAAENEDEWMKNDLQREIDRALTGSLDQRTMDAEEKMNTYEKMKSRDQKTLGTSIIYSKISSLPLNNLLFLYKRSRICVCLSLCLLKNLTELIWFSFTM